MNSYFASNFQDSVDVEHLDNIDTVQTSRSTFSVSETNFHLKRLRRKSCGPDGIPYWVLRDFSSILSPAITFLFNSSLSTGVVPSCFKMADITPIPKVRRPKEVSDFRSISLLPLLSKVLERMVLNKLVLPHIQNKTDPSQYAYIPRRGSGTISCLTLMNHLILKHLDSNSGAVRILTVDFSKAFDKITHKSILSPCRRMALPAHCIKWISSFLSERTQRVRLGSNHSPWISVTSGVPQGSVLGPVLFCLATDDLRAVHTNTIIFKYADDITFLHFLRTSTDDKLQDEWTNCLEWSSSHSLPVNTNKCKTMDIITQKGMTLGPISSSAGALPRVSNMKLLGLTFSSDMKWKAHVDAVVRKASQRLYIIRNLRRSGCEPSEIFKVYVALIRSLLLYAIPSFCNMHQYTLHSLSHVEKRAQKIIGDFPFHCDFQTAIDRTCSKLFESIERHPDHPLRTMFEERRVRSRNPCRLKAPPSKTKRFSTSFIKYCK